MGRQRGHNRGICSVIIIGCMILSRPFTRFCHDALDGTFNLLLAVIQADNQLEHFPFILSHFIRKAWNNATRTHTHAPRKPLRAFVVLEFCGNCIPRLCLIPLERTYTCTQIWYSYIYVRFRTVKVRWKSAENNFSWNCARWIILINSTSKMHLLGIYCNSMRHIYDNATDKYCMYQILSAHKNGVSDKVDVIVESNVL